MSMINSAHVFTPRPSADPRENLRVLQSPLKAPFSSDASQASSSRSPEAEGDIVLVESNCPRVVEEEKDLVILDEVTLPPEAPPSPMFMPIPVHNQAPPKTPVKRLRPSLHKAVLLRSAQRAAIRAEIEREEEMEVEEVEESIIEMDEDADGGVPGEYEQEDEGDEDEEMQDGEQEDRRSMSPWRLGIEAVKEGARMGVQSFVCGSTNSGLTEQNITN